MAAPCWGAPQPGGGIGGTASPGVPAAEGGPEAMGAKGPDGMGARGPEGRGGPRGTELPVG